jgi:hypothetical protein
MKREILLLLSAFALLPTSGSAAGIWAAAGQTPFVSSSAPPIEILAPDGKVALRETEDGLTFIGKKTVLLQEILSPPSLTEVLWSPDSKQFVVNASDGGAVGTWTAYYYWIDADGTPVSRNLVNLLAPMIEKFPDCDDAERANIGAAGWLDDGKDLLVVVEVPPHSSCRNMGAIRGFRVAVTSWRVAGEISEVKLRQDWARALGPRFAAEQGKAK